MDEEMLSNQLDLEQFLSSKQLIPRIEAEFLSQGEEGFRDYLASKGIPYKFGLDLIVQMAIHKRAKLSTLVGLLRHHYNDSQQTAHMIYLAAEADLVDYSTTLKMFQVVMDISRECQEELDRFQYPLPTVVPPKELRDNRDTGYYISRGSVILKKNHHTDDVCLDHINRLNSIPLTLDMHTAKMISNRWRNLDKAKEGETHEEFMRRRKQFEKYDRTAKDVMSLIQKINDHFYMTWKYDKRGRCYSQGYHINPQGTPWNKAVILFHEQEVTTDGADT